MMMIMTNNDDDDDDAHCKSDNDGAGDDDDDGNGLSMYNALVTKHTQNARVWRNEGQTFGVHIYR